MHGLPLTYNKDMQEDKEHLFDAVDTLELGLAAAQGHARNDQFNRERLAEAAGMSSWRRPTSLTTWSNAASRSASPTVSSPGWCVLAVEQRQRSQTDPRGARRGLAAVGREASTRCCATVPGSNLRSPAAVRARRGRQQLDARASRRSRAR